MSTVSASLCASAQERSEQCLTQISGAIEHQPDTAAGAVVDLLRTAKVGKCLVLLPYDDHHKKLYKSSIEPTVARHMFPLLLSRLPGSAAIYTSFADAMRTSSGVIVDVTDLNENVMYEVGYAHGRGLTPLLFTRNAARVNDLPVYLRTLNVQVASEAVPLDRLIEEYLCSLKATGKVLSPQPGTAVGADLMHA